MAIVTSGPFMGFSGSAGGYTYYTLPDGRTCVKRKNKKSNKPPTERQMVVRGDTSLVSDFVKPFESFIETGLKLEANITRQNPHNEMVRAVRADAIEGVYPNRKVNLSKVIVSKGDLPMAAESSVVVTKEGLAFTWSTELVPKFSHHSDQVMMLAYFPDLKQCVYTISGAQRHFGKDFLALTGINKGCTAEVYMSFITDDHSRISTSIHLGQFNW